MADANSTPPGGAVPPKGPEPVKVQPKKETVRISLPPKPTAAPTVRIPAPAAATPAVAAAAAPAAAPATTPPPAAPTAPRPAPAPVVPTVAAAPAAPRPAMAPRVAAPAAAGVGVLENALAIAAALIGVLAAVRIFMIQGMFQ